MTRSEFFDELTPRLLLKLKDEHIKRMEIESAALGAEPEKLTPEQLANKAKLMYG